MYLNSCIESQKLLLIAENLTHTKNITEKKKSKKRNSKVKVKQLKTSTFFLVRVFLERSLHLTVLTLFDKLFVHEHTCYSLI